MASSFVLSSSKSSTYPRGYVSGFDSPAALLEDHFEQPEKRGRISRAVPFYSAPYILFRGFFDEVSEFGEDQLLHHQADGVSRLGLKS
jgi:hypothetical protein